VLLAVSTVLRLFLGVVTYALVKKDLKLFYPSEEYVGFSLKITLLLLHLLVTPVVATELFNPELLSS